MCLCARLSLLPRLVWSIHPRGSRLFSLYHTARVCLVQEPCRPAGPSWRVKAPLSYCIICRLGSLHHGRFDACCKKQAGNTRTRSHTHKVRKNDDPFQCQSTGKCPFALPTVEGMPMAHFATQWTHRNTLVDCQSAPPPLVSQSFLPL